MADEDAEQHKNMLNSDGTLKIVQWARDLDSSDNGHLLSIDSGARKTQIALSNATGEGLVSNGNIGADVIRLSAGDRFVPHTHAGDHLLIVIGGDGTVTYDGKVYPTSAGQMYMIEGKIPHAVGAITDHVILAVGSPHRPIDSEERMTAMGYKEVTSEIQELHCLICERMATYPQVLHEQGCAHCPCPACCKR